MDAGTQTRVPSRRGEGTFLKSHSRMLASSTQFYSPTPLQLVASVGPKQRSMTTGDHRENPIGKVAAARQKLLKTQCTRAGRVASPEDGVPGHAPPRGPSSLPWVPQSKRRR